MLSVEQIMDYSKSSEVRYIYSFQYLGPLLAAYERGTYIFFTLLYICQIRKDQLVAVSPCSRTTTIISALPLCGFYERPLGLWVRQHSPVQRHGRLIMILTEHVKNAPP